MKLHYSLKLRPTILALSGVLLIALTGCGASRQAYTRGKEAQSAQDFDTAMAQYKIALDQHPDNVEYRLRYEKSRFAAAFNHFDKGRRAADKGDLQTAKQEFTHVLEIDPSHVLAQQEIAKINEIQSTPPGKKPEPELKYDDLKESTRTDPSVGAQLQPKISGPIDIHMPNQDSRVAFETLAQLAGLNVIFDPDFRATRIPIDLNKVDIYEALDIVALQTRTFWKPVNQTTILVSPDNQTKRRDYEELVLKTIYLSNSVTATEITEAITALRTLLNMRYLAQSTSANAIIVRDTADRIAIAEKIISDIDKAKPEVVVDVTVLEVDRNTLRQLGIQPPTSTSLTFTNPAVANPSSTSSTTTATGTTGTTTTGTTTTNANSVALNDLRALNTANFSLTIPQTVAQFLATSSDTKLIQNPQIRATDGKLASIRIGQRVPVASGSFQPAFVGATGTPVVQFQYVDVGVNLDMTPHVLLNREVSMTVLVQVQALAGNSNIGGVNQPIFTNRSIQHEIRLAEGETNILGGIITDNESTSLSGIPGLKDIPILKYFFAQETKTLDRTEIIVMLTPHIVRMPNIQEANMRGLYTGSETVPRLRTSAAVPAIGGTSPAPAPTGQLPAVTPVPPGTPSIPPATSPATTPQPDLQPANATIAFSPAPIMLTPAGQTVVNITVNGNDILGTDLTFTFDSSSFRIVEMREGGFLSRDGQIVTVVQRLETGSGTATISLERPLNAPSVSGSGNLVTLVLEPGTRSGDSVLHVADFRVRDSKQNAVPGRVAEVTITTP